jgi:hypothetical protein
MTGHHPRKKSVTLREGATSRPEAELFQNRVGL